MKKNFLIAICFIMIILTCGCFTDKKETDKRKMYYSQAKKNTIKYIEKKYGFSPNIQKTECTYSNSDMFASNCNEDILVTAEYNGKRFQVIIDGSKTSEEGKDNYQYQDIVTKIINIIDNNIEQPYKYKVYFGYKGKGLINEYYNGNNIIDILSPLSNNVTLLAEYIDKDNVSQIREKLNSTDFSIFSKLYIVNYKSLDSYKITKSHDYNIRGSYLESLFYENSSNLKNVLTKVYTKVEYYDFS